MQWNQTPCTYLRRNFCQVQNQEQTLQLRLPEGMPDAARVIATWGMPLISSKQWRSDSIEVSGGISAWTLYAPEDGGTPQIVESWLPFQGKWGMDSKREGTIRTKAVLRSIDTRLLSARKMLVRASVGLLCEAMEPDQVMVFAPEEPPSDLQLLQKTYPMCIAKESGEKTFYLEEEMTLQHPAEKLVAWDLEPVLTEEAVLGDKAVFKGNCNLHFVYMDEEGQLRTQDAPFAYAQYGDLDGEYDKEATVHTVLALISCEMELLDGKVNVKAEVAAQYVVQDMTWISLAEDAYSPIRTLEKSQEELQLPAVLQNLTKDVTVLPEGKDQLARVVESRFYPDYPVQYREDGNAVVEIPGIWVHLGNDEAGNLVSVSHPVCERLELPAGEGCGLRIDLFQTEPGCLKLDIQTSAQQSIPMLTDIQLGEAVEPDPNRPTLILRPMEEKGLWELAKDCGSTVEAIWKANRLTAEPMPGQMLLIPVS